MFRPQKPQQVQVRLPKQQVMPSLSDLQFMLSESQKIPGRTVELPWSNGPDMLSMVAARVDEMSSEPLWTYYEGVENDMKPKWSYPTGDISLIHNLCSQQSASADFQYTPVGIRENAPLSMLNNMETTMQLPPTIGGDGPKTILAGDLSNMQVPTLLQSINMSKMTGRLMLDSKGSRGNIWFEQGAPMDATSLEHKGDQALVEMITWEEGTFQFFPDQTTAERNVKRRLDGLIMEGVTLLDQNKYLEEQNCKIECIPVKAYPNLTEEQFAQALSKGAPINMDMQKRLYVEIDGRSSLIEILRRYPLSKLEWIPVMFNLISCGLIKMAEPQPGESALPVVQIDRTAIQSVIRSLTRPETGLYTYPAFLFFLEQEFFKCAAMGWPLSLMVFEMKIRYGDLLESVPLSSLREVAKRIDGVKRSFDVYGHYEVLDFAMFLPNTSGNSARTFAIRLNEVLAGQQIIPGPPNSLQLYFGVASAPEDTQDLGVLLSAAREAKRIAKEKGSVVTLFREMHGR